MSTVTESNNTQVELAVFFRELADILSEMSPGARKRICEGILLYAGTGQTPDAETQRRILMEHLS